MKPLKRKAKRIADRSIKKKITDKTNIINKPSIKKKSIKTSDFPQIVFGNNQNSYAGSEKEMLDIVVKLIVKIIKKEVDL